MKAVDSLVDAGLPAKLSARQGNRFYSDRAVPLSDKIDVILDGVVLEHATSWDVEAGEIVRHRRDKDGAMILEKGAPTFETLRGIVEVRWRREEGDAA